MRWGSIVQVNLDPTVGSEAGKVRPALVVSNDRANVSATRNRRGVITILPITSNVTKVYAFQALISEADLSGTGLSVPSKIQAEQIRAVDVNRILGELGSLPDYLHEHVREALALHLDLDLDLPSAY